MKFLAVGEAFKTPGGQKLMASGFAQSVLKGDKGDKGEDGDTGPEAALFDQRVQMAANSGIIPSATTDYQNPASKLTDLTLNLEAGKTYDLTGTLILETFINPGDRAFGFKFRQSNGADLTDDQVIMQGVNVGNFASMRVGSGSNSDTEFQDTRTFSPSNLITIRMSMTVICYQSVSVTLYARAIQKHDLQILAKSYLGLKEI